MDDTNNNRPAVKKSMLENFKPIDSLEKMETIDLKEGEGEKVLPNALVRLHFTGAYCNSGTVFESSYDIDDPICFNLSTTIKGWADGIPGMKVGGTRRLIIPSKDITEDNSHFPKDSDLVFDIKLVEILS